MGTIATEQLSLLAGLRLKSQPSRLASIERRFPVAVALRIDPFVIRNHSEKYRPAITSRSIFQLLDLAGYLATKRLLAMHLWTGQ